MQVQYVYNNAYNKSSYTLKHFIIYLISSSLLNLLPRPHEWIHPKLTRLIVDFIYLEISLVSTFTGSYDFMKSFCAVVHLRIYISKHFINV